MKFTSRTNHSILSPWGSICFEAAGDGTYFYVPKSEKEKSYIKNTGFFKRGDITAEGDESEKAPEVAFAPVADAAVEPEAVEPSVEVVDTVANVKEAMDWLVEHKGVKRRIISRGALVEWAATLGVEFPKLIK